jgi:hypothetical protein
MLTVAKLKDDLDDMAKLAPIVKKQQKIVDEIEAAIQ